MSIQHAAGKKKHLILTIAQKLEIILGLEMWRKLKKGYGFIQYWIINHSWYKEMEGPVLIVYGIKKKCEGPFQVTDIETTKISAV
jgi:hypothetical protein